ncbi:MAG: hypothetical protein H6Q73_3283 [Firmicutes bacterium]|nr:hypothetical protein [Bacillota bacterium]
MPKGDGNGPAFFGSGLFGGGRRVRRGNGLGRGRHGGVDRGNGFTGKSVIASDMLEEQAVYLENLAANLRSLAIQKVKAE